VSYYLCKKDYKFEEEREREEREERERGQGPIKDFGAIDE
jgi:hypothetical protein